MNNFTSVRIVVYGRVQGVSFRAFTAEQASGLNVKGFVRNVPGGMSVEVVAEGDRASLEKLIEILKTGPPAAKVERLETTWTKDSDNYPDFRIVH